MNDTCAKCGKPVNLKPVELQRTYAKSYHHEKYKCEHCGHAAHLVTRVDGKEWPR